MPADDDPAMPELPLLVDLLQLAVKDRTQLALENIALPRGGRSGADRRALFPYI